MTERNPDRSQERALLARLIGGDHDAFRDLVLPYVPAMLRYTYVILQSSDLAEDVVQDVLVWLWEHRSTLEIPGSIRGYLLTAVRHRALNLISQSRAESRRGERFVQETFNEQSSTSPAQLVEHQDLENALASAIRELPTRRQEILLLRQQGLSYSEIASIMNISTKTVEAQVRLAFIRLRELLAPWFQEK